MYIQNGTRQSVRRTLAMLLALVIAFCQMPVYSLAADLADDADGVAPAAEEMIQDAPVESDEMSEDPETGNEDIIEDISSEQTEELSEEPQESAEEPGEVADEIEEISEETGNIEETSEETAEEISETTEEVEELSDETEEEITEISEEANEATEETAEEISETTEEAEELSDETEEEITEITEEANEATEETAEENTGISEEAPEAAAELSEQPAELQAELKEIPAEPELKALHKHHGPKMDRMRFKVRVNESFKGNKYHGLMNIFGRAWDAVFNGGRKTTGLKKVKVQTEVIFDGWLPEDTEAYVDHYEVSYLPDEIADDAIMAYEITLESEGLEYQPDVPLEVSISNDMITAALESGNTLMVYHIDDYGVMSRVDDDDVSVRYNADGSATLTFVAESFSVYAVVSGGEDARLDVVFRVGDEEVAESFVKYGDDLESVIYDPGVGSLEKGVIFKGWTTDENYGPDEDALSIEEVREDISAMLPPDSDLETVTYHAVLIRQYSVNYLDETGTSIGQETADYRADQGAAPTVSYTVNMSYTPVDDQHDFQGWFAVSGSGAFIKGHDSSANDGSGTIYENGDRVDIRGNVTFSVNAPEGNWLVFDENGKGATYNAPQFVLSGAETEAPGTVMLRKGYSFGGWYCGVYDGVDEDGEPRLVTDESGLALLDGAEAFTFGRPLTEKTTVYAKWTPVSAADYTVLIWKQDLSGNDYDFEEAVHLSGTVGTAVNTVSQIGSGNSAYARVNGMNKTYKGFHLSGYDKNVAIKAEGSSVVNVYYDRTEYTLRFQVLDYSYTVSANDKDNSPAKYGDVDGSRARIYWKNNAFRTSDRNNGDVYTGTVYTRSGSQSWQEIRTISALYQQPVGENFPIVGSNGVIYDNGERWDPQSNNAGLDQVIVYLDVMPEDNVTFRLDTATRPLKTMNWYVEALPGDSDTKAAPNTLYSFSNSRISAPAGKVYTLYNSISARYNGATVEDFIDIAGFERLGASGQRSSEGFYAYSTTKDGTIDFYYTRKSYVVNFMDGVYVDGNGNPVNEMDRGQLGESGSIVFGAGTESAAFVPEAPAGYVFEGWYIDSSCSRRYDFTTMPEGGVTVYAKWRQIQYRVFLHPNAGTDPSLDWGSGSQSMNFRVSYGDKISAPTGLRNGYAFVGWYMDPGFTKVFNESYVLNESTVKNEYDKTVDMTDDMDKYGRLSDESWNADLIGNDGSDRFWITKKLDLYAKWRVILEGADGISVQYETADPAVEASVSQIMTGGIYADNSRARAMAAASAPEGFRFDRWVMQTYNAESGRFEDAYEDGKPVTVYPGREFTVLAENARVSLLEGEYRQDLEGNHLDNNGNITEDPAKFVQLYQYTVQLRAQYKPAEEADQTFIAWFLNDGSGAVRVDSIEELPADGEYSEELLASSALGINEARDVMEGQSRTGYAFLGWARVTMGSSVAEAAEFMNEVSNRSQDLSEEDLYLFYDGSYHLESADGAEVTAVAADEDEPYQAMFAVWAKTYSVFMTVGETTKVYTGSEQEFSGFTPSFKYGEDEVDEADLIAAGIDVILTGSGDNGGDDAARVVGTEVGTYTASVTAELTLAEGSRAHIDSEHSSADTEVIMIIVPAEGEDEEDPGQIPDTDPDQNNDTDPDQNNDTDPDQNNDTDPDQNNDTEPDQNNDTDPDQNNDTDPDQDPDNTEEPAADPAAGPGAVPVEGQDDEPVGEAETEPSDEPAAEAETEPSEEPADEAEAEAAGETGTQKPVRPADDSDDDDDDDQDYDADYDDDADEDPADEMVPGTADETIEDEDVPLAAQTAEETPAGPAADTAEEILAGTAEEPEAETIEDEAAPLASGLIIGSAAEQAAEPVISPKMQAAPAAPKAQPAAVSRPAAGPSNIHASAAVYETPSAAVNGTGAKAVSVIGPKLEGELIEDEKAPLSGFTPLSNAAWALINLLAVIGTCVTSIGMIVTYFRRKEDEEEAEEGRKSDKDEEPRRNSGKFLGLIPAIAAVIVFILTENMHHPMVLADEWTMLMAAVMVVNILLACATRNGNEKNEDPEQNR